jgi:hypothetical protein
VTLPVLLSGLPTADQLARAWTRAIARTSHVPMSRRGLRAYLAVLAGDLLDALTAGDFDPAGPFDLGGTPPRQPGQRDRRHGVAADEPQPLDGQG